MMPQSNIILREWNNVARSWLIEAQSPLSQATLLPEPTSGKANGYIELECPQRTALYSYKQKLFLQLGDRIFDWESARIKVLQGRLTLHKNFSLIMSRLTIVKLMLYSSEVGKALDIPDPTFDVMEEETTDWWLWLSRVSRDKRLRRKTTDLFANGMFENTIS